MNELNNVIDYFLECSHTYDKRFSLNLTESLLDLKESGGVWWDPARYIWVQWGPIKVQSGFPGFSLSSLKSPAFLSLELHISFRTLLIPLNPLE